MRFLKYFLRQSHVLPLPSAVLTYEDIITKIIIIKYRGYLLAVMPMILKTQKRVMAPICKRIINKYASRNILKGQVWWKVFELVSDWTMALTV